MTRTFVVLPQAPKRVPRTEHSKAKAAIRPQKRTAQIEERSQKRRQKVQKRIYAYVTSQDKEVIYAETLDCLIDELIKANVVGESLRGKSDYAIAQAFREIQDVILGGIPELTLHINVGEAMLGIEEAYWPMAPFSPYSDDGAPAVPESMLRRCLRGKHAVHEY